MRRYHMPTAILISTVDTVVAGRYFMAMGTPAGTPIIMEGKTEGEKSIMFDGPNKNKYVLASLQRMLFTISIEAVVSGKPWSLSN